MTTKGRARLPESWRGEIRKRTGASTRGLSTQKVLKKNRNKCGRDASDVLNNRAIAADRHNEQGVIRHSPLMRSNNVPRAGQCAPAYPLVSGAEWSLSDPASLGFDSSSGFLLLSTKELDPHKFCNSGGKMVVRSEAVKSRVFYPNADYCLAKSTHVREFTRRSSASPVSPVSPMTFSRRLVDPYEDLHTYTQGIRHARRVTTRSITQWDTLSSAVTKPGCTGLMHPRQDTPTGKRGEHYNLHQKQATYRVTAMPPNVKRSSPIAGDAQLSPVTISSGYESDCVPSPIHSDNQCRGSVNIDDDHTDYFSQSDTYPKSEVAADTNQNLAGGTGTLSSSLNSRSRHEPFVPSIGKSRFVRLGHHHNDVFVPCHPGQPIANCHKQQTQKLAKVTRSMYAIIHDLQHEYAPRKTMRYSSDAVRVNHGCGRGDDSDNVFRSLIVSPDLRTSTTDALTPQSEIEGKLYTRSPQNVEDDSPARYDLRSPFFERVFVSPDDNNYCQVRKQRQCDMPAGTRILPNLDIKHQSAFEEDDNVKPADRADDNFSSELVMREVHRQRYKYCKGSEPHSNDSEHIYDVIPGDESSMLTSHGAVVRPSEVLKLSKWSTVVDLGTPTSTSTEVPPTLPERRYSDGVEMDPPLPPRTFRKVCPSVVCSNPRVFVCDSSYDDYATVCKKKTFDNMSLDGHLDRLDEEGDILSDLDSELYSRVCPPFARQRNTFDFSDLISETYCRLEPVKPGQEKERWSPGDVLNFIDGIHEPHTPKTRENIYCILQNSKTRAKFSESLEIETRLLHKGLLQSPWEDEDLTDSTMSGHSMVPGHSMMSGHLYCTFPQEIQPTYV